MAFGGWMAVTQIVGDSRHWFLISSLTFLMAILVAQTRMESGVHSFLEVTYGGQTRSIPTTGTTGPDRIDDTLGVADSAVWKALFDANTGVKTFACMNGLILPGRQVFIVDTHVNYDPTAEQVAEITIMAAEELKRFGVAPKAALLSHSNFGTSNQPSALKMREALALLREQAPWLEVDGEMHGDAALDPAYRSEVMPRSTLNGEANLVVLPNIDAANISYNLLKTAAGGGIAIGPVLLGAAKPVHVLTPSATVRRIVNMTALTVADANAAR